MQHGPIYTATYARIINLYREMTEAFYTNRNWITYCTKHGIFLFRLDSSPHKTFKSSRTRTHIQWCVHSSEYGYGKYIKKIITTTLHYRFPLKESPLLTNYENPTLWLLDDLDVRNAREMKSKITAFTTFFMRDPIKLRGLANTLR